MTTDARGLAASLAAQSDDALTLLFLERAVSPRAPWRDFFDAADALLEPASIEQSLKATPRHRAAQLMALSAHQPVAAVDPALVAAGLVSGDGTIFSAVSTAVQSKQISPPVATEFAAETEPIGRSAERAFTTIGHIADLLSALLVAPLAQIGSGAVSAADRRRLAETNVVDDPDNVDALLRIASTADLAASGDRLWMATPLGADWLARSNRDRWQHVARALVRTLPAGLRTETGETISVSEWHTVYPWNEDWPGEADQLRATLFLLGVVTTTGRATPWSEPLLASGEADADRLSELLPHEVSQIYLQNDLTAISPGPLEAALDIRLRSMALRESHAQASTYRFTSATLMDAVTGGETEESMTEFLSQISLTGIPQPLAYLVGESARRHGSIRVGLEDETGRTLVTAQTPQMLDTIFVDQSLRALAFIRQGDALATRVARDTVAIALADAHYPVTLISPDGTPERLQRHRLADASTQRARPYDALLQKLREVEDSNSDAAWLERELEIAVRLRSTITVTVSLPGSDERTFTLEASGIGGGRLRGLDRAADVERTLPLSHITTISLVN